MPSLEQGFAITNVFVYISRPNSSYYMFKQVILHTCAVTQNWIPTRQSATLKYMDLFSKESYLIRFSELVSLINTNTSV